MIRRFFLIAFFIAMLATTGLAQSTRPSPKPPVLPPATGSNESRTTATETDQDSSLPDEMRVRLYMERKDSEHRKFMEDVKQLDDLSAAIKTAYHDHNTLTSEDFKKVATIEKLAKRILSHAGGNHVEEDKKPLDTPIADVLKELSESASEISNNLMSQTRHVVSMVVINSSNKVITLARFILRNKKQND